MITKEQYMAATEPIWVVTKDGLAMSQGTDLNDPSVSLTHRLELIDETPGRYCLTEEDAREEMARRQLVNALRNGG